MRHNHCDKCTFYLEADQFGGWCRKSPPVVDPNVEWAVFPKVHKHCGCGEFLSTDAVKKMNERVACIEEASNRYWHHASLWRKENESTPS